MERIEVDCSLVIIPKILNCFRWSKAYPGRVPPRKATTDAGVLSISFCRFCVFCLMKVLIISVSALFRTMEPMPERSTGVAYRLWIRRAAAGLPWCPLARPTGSTATRVLEPSCGQQIDWKCEQDCRRWTSEGQHVLPHLQTQSSPPPPQ